MITPIFIAVALLAALAAAVNPLVRVAFLDLVRKQKRVELHGDSLRRRDGSTLQILENVIGHFDAHGELDGDPRLRH